MQRGYLSGGRVKRSIWTSTVRLIGHLAAAGLIFVAFMVLEWLAGFALDWLNRIHPFHPDTLNVLSKVSIWLTYIDWIVCTIVILAGAIRFLSEVIRGDI